MVQAFDHQKVKRILIYSTQLMKNGGIESHLNEFCHQMAKVGVEIDLVILNSQLQPTTAFNYRQICRRVYLGNNGRSFFRVFWLFLIALKCRNVRYNAIYSNGQGNSIGVFLKLLGKKRNWVHHHHTSGDIEDQKTWTKGYWKSLNFATHVIACSRKNAYDMEKVLRRKVDTIPCFSRKIRTELESTSLRSTVHLGYYGRLIPEKGIDTICKLSEDLEIKDMDFQIWGEGNKYPPQFFKKFKRLSYHGPFDGEEKLEEILKSLDGYLLLSVHPEGLPICLLESMGAGLPWLATDRGGIPDIVSDPISTRMISASSDYNAIKKAVISFGKDIREGRTSRKEQINFYNMKFSSDVLLTQWGEFLGL